MANISVPGVAASSAGSTMSEASTVEVQEPGVTSPTPELTPQDFSSWSLQFPGAPQTRGLLPPSGGGVGRQAEGSWDPAAWAPTLQSQVPGEHFRFVNKGRADQLPPISCQRHQPVTQWLLISYQCRRRAYLWLPISYRCHQQANLWLLTSCRCHQ